MYSQVDRVYVKKVRQVVAEEDFFGRARRNDLESRYPSENIAALQAVGVPGMCIDRCHGGPEHTVATQTRVIEAVAYGDPSTAACVNMHWVVADIIAEHVGRHPLQAALLRDCAARQAMFAGGASIPAGELDAGRVGARFRRVEGGWRGSGRVGFATNADGAAYVGTVAVLVDAAERPIGRRILVLNPPVSTPGIQVLRDWDAMGLRATATHTIVIEDAFVGPGHAFEIDLDELKPGVDGEEAGRTGMSLRRARSQISKGGMWLGHCQHLYDLIVDFMGQRRGTGAVVVDRSSLASRSHVPWAQRTLGEMRHWIESGRLVLYGTVDVISAEALDEVARADRVLIAMYHMRRMCEEVATCTFRLAGAHGFVATRPFERMYRDLMGYVATAFKAPELLEHIGRAGLGLPFAVNASGG
jgi:alkylation response protein AidB-like acyl-CoA dehydrogenase